MVTEFRVGRACSLLRVVETFPRVFWQRMATAGPLCHVGC